MKKSTTPFQWNFTREDLASRAPSCGRLTQPRPCVTLIPNGNTKLAHRVSRKPQKRCHLNRRPAAEESFDGRAGAKGCSVR